MELHVASCVSVCVGRAHDVHVFGVTSSGWARCSRDWQCATRCVLQFADRHYSKCVGEYTAKSDAASHDEVSTCNVHVTSLY